MDSIWLLHLFAHQLQSQWGSSLDPGMSHQNADLKQIDFQLFLQQKWVYLQVTKRVCNHGKLHASPYTARGEKLFQRGEKEVGKALVNK